MIGSLVIGGALLVIVLAPSVVPGIIALHRGAALTALLVCALNLLAMLLAGVWLNQVAAYPNFVALMWLPVISGALTTVSARVVLIRTRAKDG